MATASPSSSCDPCKNSGKNQAPVAFCLECRNLYCKICFDCHRKQKTKTSHQYVKLSGTEERPCSQCQSCNDSVTSSLCTECRELYCSVCTNYHLKFTATKNHVILKLNCHQPNTEVTKIVSGLADLELDVTYSGAQVPVKKNGPEKQVGTAKDNNKLRTTDFASKKQATVATRSHIKETPLSAKRLRRFSAREMSDKKYVDITRVISMPDDRIVVIDYNANFFKLYASNYMLHDELCTGPCYTVAVVDQDTVAVGVFSLRYYSLKANKIRYSGKELKCEDRIYDIAYRRGKFIIRYEKDKMDYTCYGKNLIVKQNRYVTHSDFMFFDSVYDCVILSNNKEETVASYTITGEENWKIRVAGGPHGIVVVNGIILVAVHNEQTIRQITMDGRLLRKPLLTKDDGIVYTPYAIAYQPKSHRLLVSKFNDADVVVFNLSP